MQSFLEWLFGRWGLVQQRSGMKRVQLGLRGAVAGRNGCQREGPVLTWILTLKWVKTSECYKILTHGSFLKACQSQGRWTVVCLWPWHGCGVVRENIPPISPYIPLYPLYKCTGESGRGIKTVCLWICECVVVCETGTVPEGEVWPYPSSFLTAARISGI